MDKPISADMLVEALQAGALDPNEMLVDQLIAQAHERGQMQYEVLAAAALPRRFDSDALAAAVATSRDDPSFAGAFNELLTQSYVHERRAKSWTLHDSVRNPLRERWQRNTLEGLDQTQSIERLIGHYHAEYSQGLEARDALQRISPVVRPANTERYHKFSSEVDDAISRPAIEMQHLGLRIAPNRGLAILEATMSELEARRASNLADLVLHAFSADIENLEGPEQETMRQWANYFGARSANQRLDRQRARDHIEKIDESPISDDKLAAWTYIERVNLASSESRWHDALRVAEAGTAFYESSDADPWNANIIWSQKASIFGMLWDWSEELTASRRGLELAIASGNRSAAAHQHITIAQTLDPAMKTDEALDHLLAGVRLARELGAEGDGNALAASRITASGIQTVCGRRSRRLLHMASVQLNSLSAAGGVEARIETMRQTALALSSGGAEQPAIDLYETARALARSERPDLIPQIDADQAGAHLPSQENENVELNLALLENFDGADPWDEARLSTNAAINLLAIGRLEHAARLVARAELVFRDMDHERAISFLHSLRGETLRRRGDYDGAAKEFEAAGDRAARGYDASTLMYRSRLAHDLGDYVLATELATRGRDRTPLDEPIEVLQRTLTAALYAVAAAQRDKAAQLTLQAAEQTEAIRRFTAWEPTPEVDEADYHAALAIESLIRPRGDKEGRLKSAREHLRAASDADPTLGWYLIEMAMLDGIAGRPAAARSHLTAAQKRIEDPLLRAAVKRLHDDI